MVSGTLLGLLELPKLFFRICSCLECTTYTTMVVISIQSKSRIFHVHVQNIQMVAFANVHAD